MSLFGLSTQADVAPLRASQALAHGLARMVRIAQALHGSGREIDLEGLDSAIGLLCARALDLPSDQGRAIRSDLIALSQEVGGLCHALSAMPGPKPLGDGSASAAAARL